jgi:hypothetical protein
VLRRVAPFCSKILADRRKDREKTTDISYPRIATPENFGRNKLGYPPTEPFWAPRYFKVKTTGWIPFQPLAQSFATLKTKFFKAQ